MNYDDLTADIARRHKELISLRGRETEAIYKRQKFLWWAAFYGGTALVAAVSAWGFHDHI